MKEFTVLAPVSGCCHSFSCEPVVALRLPPANLCNRFAVNRDVLSDGRNEVMPMHLIPL
jgi:hypothetical protein